MHQISVCMFSKFGAAIPNLSSRDLCLKLSSVCNWKQTPEPPASNDERIFCDCKFLFCFVLSCVMLCFFVCLFVCFLGKIKDLRQ